MKRFDLNVPDSVPSVSLNAWLQTALPQLSASALLAAFRSRDVKVNGKRVEKTERLTPGSTVTVFVPDQAVHDITISCLFENEDLAIVVKPAGISSEPAVRGEKDIAALFSEQNGGKAYYPCHRLDNPTEGILLLAKNEKTLNAMQDAFRQHCISKEYLCVVKGHPDPAEGLWRDWLVKDPIHASVSVYHHQRTHAKEIITGYKVLDGGKISLVRVRLYTGRTHQIRAHFAAYTHPLLGDDQYGDRDWNRNMHGKRLMLCAFCLHFDLEDDYSYLNSMHFSHIPSFFPKPWSSEKLRSLISER